MMFPRSSVSPIPTYTTSGFDSATATAPTDEDEKDLSETGRQVTPPSVVFQSPPPVAPKSYSSGRLPLPATACDRPPRAGPIDRHFNPVSSAGSIASLPAAVGA